MRFGYGEVWTPTMEYEDVLVQGDERAAGASYRLFDEHGQVLALRSDMTIPIARLVATRFADAEPPLRFCYLSHAYRAVRPQRGQQREFLQAGIELIGADAPEGTVEVLEVLWRRSTPAACRARASGSATPGCSAGCCRAMERRARSTGKAVLEALARHDLVELERRVAELDVDARAAAHADRPAAAARRPRGDRARGRARRRRRPRRDLAPAPRSPTASPSAGIAERVIFDLGLVRDLGYYTGAIFEVYDPALGHVIGGGGRYDDLLGAVRPGAAGVRVRAVRGAHARRTGRGGAHPRGGRTR